MPFLLDKIKLLRKSYRNSFLTILKKQNEPRKSEDTTMENLTEYGYMDGRTFVIGRTGDIRIDDQTVSKAHARLTFEEGLIKLTDLRSSNGTYVEKYGKFVRCNEMYISAKTRIILGDSVYTVKSLLASQDSTGHTDEIAKLCVKNNLL